MTGGVLSQWKDVFPSPANHIQALEPVEPALFPFGPDNLIQTRVSLRATALSANEGVNFGCGRGYVAMGAADGQQLEPLAAVGGSRRRRGRGGVYQDTDGVWG